MSDARLVLFVDEQNAYRGARDAFYNRNAHHTCGNVHLVKVADLLAHRIGECYVEEVRIYTGEVNPRRSSGGAKAQMARINGDWKRDGATVVTRPLKYEPDGTAREKGIDVSLAVDFVDYAIANKFDIGIIFSADTDLLPALELVRDRFPDKSPQTVSWYRPRRMTSCIGGGFKNHALEWEDYQSIRNRWDYRLHVKHFDSPQDLSPGLTDNQT